MSNKFADCLIDTRQTKQLTQQEMVDMLVQRHRAFEKLDLTTYSRWERGVTSPKLAKQVLFARTFSIDLTRVIPDKVKAPSKGLNLIDDFYQQILSPYSTTLEGLSIFVFDKLPEDQEIIRSLCSFNKDYLGIHLNHELLKSNKLSCQVYKNSNGDLLGHLLYGFIATNCCDFKNERNNLVDCHFVDPDNENQSVSLYVISSFGAIPIARMALLINIVDMLKNNLACKSLLINCHHQTGFDLLSSPNLDCQIRFKGQHVVNSGVKLYNNRYRYVQVEVPTENLLSAKGIHDIIKFTSDYYDLLSPNND
ncbi:helix-turn-helix transcriptional regulator [Vibrio chagasii]|uniref:helix-turn-helix transcriptional regulator n=1 Tax=Vibrio chagasii TaxID=170679 RepID=UPI0040678060